jgi:hypothetical protein
MHVTKIDQLEEKYDALEARLLQSLQDQVLLLDTIRRLQMEKNTASSTAATGMMAFQNKNNNVIDDDDDKF